MTRAHVVAESIFALRSFQLCSNLVIPGSEDFQWSGLYCLSCADFKFEMEHDLTSFNKFTLFDCEQLNFSVLNWVLWGEAERKGPLTPFLEGTREALPGITEVRGSGWNG